MKRTQLNVSIDPKLLEKIKESARISGKSLVGFVSDCFVNQIENLPVESIDSRFQTIEQRLQLIENNLISGVVYGVLERESKRYFDLF